MGVRSLSGGEAGRAALIRWKAAPEQAERVVLAAAVRYTLALLAEQAPGRSTEVRVPPFGAVQCVQGTVHRRGTPPNTVECDAQTWLGLATGALTWTDALSSGEVRTSGIRADLDALLPLRIPLTS